MMSLRGGDNDESLASNVAQLAIDPRRGRIVPLRTKDEVRASLETYQAYVVELPARYAGVVKDVVQKAIPELKTADFQHLRRVVQFKFLPPHLQKTFKSSRGDEETLLEVDATELDDTVRYFLVAPTTTIQQAALLATLRQNPPYVDRNAPPRIFIVTVPALAPTSPEQAAKWSIDYWPIAYKNTNPYGPHPSLVARNAAEVEPDAAHWLTLAKSAGDEICSMGYGEPIGCIIVNNNGDSREVIAVAGDCRWRSQNGGTEAKEGPGNVMAHSVLRAIAMVAKKRLLAAGKDPALLDRSSFCDSPLTDLEKVHYSKSNIPSNGYLCVELDIYITHEPCVMCSMAILHSRFKRCIVGRRLPRTGGLTADTIDGKVNNTDPNKGLGHGIFWRPSELNWKLLAWEWKDEDEINDGMITMNISDTLHA